MEKLTDAQIELIKKPLPDEAITQHPTKTYLSSIKAIYVTERLNEVFGIGAWRIRTDKIEDGNKGMVVVKVIFEVPNYGIYYESFGGNDNGGEGNKNFDLGDAYKGATTDAITKIASYIGIGIDVFKGKQKGGKTPIKDKEEIKTGSAKHICKKCGVLNENAQIKQGKFGPYFVCDSCGGFSNSNPYYENGENNAKPGFNDPGNPNN